MTNEEDTGTAELIEEAHLAILRHHTDEAEVLLKLALSSDHDNAEARRMLDRLPAQPESPEPERPDPKAKPRLDLTAELLPDHTPTAVIAKEVEALVTPARPARVTRPGFFSPWQGWSSPLPGWLYTVKLFAFIGVGIAISYLPAYVRPAPAVYGPPVQVVHHTIGAELHIGIAGNLLLGTALGLSAFFAFARRNRQ